MENFSTSGTLKEVSTPVQIRSHHSEEEEMENFKKSGNLKEVSTPVQMKRNLPVYLSTHLSRFEVITVKRRRWRTSAHQEL